METKVLLPKDIIIPEVPPMVQYVEPTWETQEVHACEVGPKFITYQCPMCSCYHYHGSNGLMHNRTETRMCQCKYRRSKKVKDVRITIDEKTYRTVIW